VLQWLHTNKRGDIMTYASKLFNIEVSDLDACRYSDELVEFASEFGYAQPAYGWDEDTVREAIEFIREMELVEEAGRLIHEWQCEDLTPYPKSWAKLEREDGW